MAPPSPVIDICPLRAEHTKGFYEVFSTVIRERRYLTYLDPPPFQKTCRFIEQAIADDWTMLIACRNVDGEPPEVVGWCSIIPKPQPIFAHCATLGMALLPEVRGFGIGRRLVDAALSDADGKGLTRVELTVFTDNAPAIALYRKTGFLIEGELRNDALVDGTYRNAFIMARLNLPCSP